MKRRRNPHTNSYYCPKTPQKVRYLKAAFAWQVGARRMKKTGEQLYVYRCDACAGGWHLTRQNGPDAVRIDTKAAPVPAHEDEAAPR